MARQFDREIPEDGLCPNCGGGLVEVTTVPLYASGRCDVLVTCEECDWESEATGTDSVL